jgi:hypothetical protein
MRNREGRQTGQVWKVVRQTPASDGDDTYESLLRAMFRNRGLQIESEDNDHLDPPTLFYGGLIDLICYTALSFVLITTVPGIKSWVSGLHY